MGSAMILRKEDLSLESLAPLAFEFGHLANRNVVIPAESIAGNRFKIGISNHEISGKTGRPSIDVAMAFQHPVKMLQIFRGLQLFICPTAGHRKGLNKVSASAPLQSPIVGLKNHDSLAAPPVCGTA